MPPEASRAPTPPPPPPPDEVAAAAATAAAPAAPLVRSWKRPLIAALVLGLAIGSGTLFLNQRLSLSQRQSLRSAAQSRLDASLADARRGGLTGVQLDPIVREERRILAQPAVPAVLLVFQGRESDHLTSEATALRGLVTRVGTTVRAATAQARAAAAGRMSDYQGAITAAQEAGLDASSDLRAISRARVALAAAGTPAAVGAAIEQLTDRIAVLRQSTADKIDADNAAAAAQAALNDSRGSAQTAIDRAQHLLDQASSFPQLKVADLASALAQARAAFQAATTGDAYDSAAQTASGAAKGLSQLLAARSDAYSDMASARRTIQDALGAHIDVGGAPGQLDGLQAQLDGAGTAPQFRGIMGQIDAISSPIADRLGTAQLGAGKVIVISLDRQQLTAYQDGSPFLSTQITTGRPALPTPPGTTSVLSKSHPWTMVSDWPQSSPFWYPPSEVQYVLWFRQGGYGIHDAPWRGAYGPGTQAHGSHGCVNVPFGQMVSLFNWADVGTRVIVS